MEWEKGDFLISTDKNKLDLQYIHHYLSKESYWAEGIPFETVSTAIENSVCFGIYYQQKQIGFARMVTDEATFGYLADVFVDVTYRGRGLSKWLMEVLLDCPPFPRLRRIMLATRDAQGLYAQYGFVHPATQEEIMYIRRPDIYKKGKGPAQ